MKTITFILVIFLFTSCTKEFSNLKTENEIELKIKGETYFTTVNGSSGYYWKITLTSSMALSVDYRVVYEFNDGAQIGLTLSHPMNATSTGNIAYTQYTASSPSASISKVKIIRVDGADLYKFTLVQ